MGKLILHKDIVSELETEIRKYKIRSLLSDEEVIKPNYNNLPKAYLKAIKYASRYGIITGGNVLRLYGLIKRMPVDVDVVIDNTTATKLKTDKILMNHDYGNITKEVNSIGNFYKDGMSIDFFIDDRKPKVEIQGIEFDDFLNVINKKLEWYRSGEYRNKDIHDFIDITNVLKGEKITYPEEKSKSWISRIFG